MDSDTLDRFIEAQRASYSRALAEIRSGRKETHWMWYVFPQFQGLGFSTTSRLYAIASLDEAEAYLRHPVLGPRLHEIARAALEVDARQPADIFGSPDDMKLRSCATLFASISPPGSVFQQVLDRYFAGEPDELTLQLIGRSAGPPASGAHNG